MDGRTQLVKKEVLGLDFVIRYSHLILVHVTVIGRFHLVMFNGSPTYDINIFDTEHQAYRWTMRQSQNISR